MTTMLRLNATNRKGVTAKLQIAWSLLMIVGLAVTATTAWSAESNADAKPANKLLGTWKLVSAKYGGEEFKFEEGITTVKHVTTTQFMWASYDKDGKVTRTAGGDYTIKGEVYQETPKYGISSDFDIIKGKAHSFRWDVQGNKWHHNGKLSNGLTIEEIWERVEKN